MINDYDGREFRCPFCGELLEPPEVVKLQFGEAEGGFCKCGAVYVYDRTGKMLGEAFVNALVMAYGNYDAAFSAGEQDYEDAVLVYEPRLRRFLPDKDRLPGRGRKFFFLRRKSKL